MVHHSLSFDDSMHKRYYDAWEKNEDSVKTIPNRHKFKNKDDPCENKPLWFLKYQVHLGRLSPFYDCLIDHGLERK